MEYDLMIENTYKVENKDFCVYASQLLRGFADKSFNELNLNKKKNIIFF